MTAIALTETDFLRYVLTDAPTYGWEVCGADNGEEAITTTDIEVAIEWSHQCDVGNIYLRDLLDPTGGNRATMFVVWQGQGSTPAEVLNDYSDKLNPLVEAAWAYFDE